MLRCFVVSSFAVLCCTVCVHCIVFQGDDEDHRGKESGNADADEEEEKEDEEEENGTTSLALVLGKVSLLVLLPKSLF